MTAVVYGTAFENAGLVPTLLQMLTTGIGAQG